MSSDARLEAPADAGAARPRKLAEGDAGPVGEGERLIVLDVLRGFALGGVLVSNLYLFYSGWFCLPPDHRKAALAVAANKAAGFVFSFFVLGKFVTIFCFLFGLGFTVHTARAEARGAPAARLHVRRLAILLLLGGAHLAALWYGDILHVYAVLGLALLLFRRSSARALLAWGVALALLGAAIGVGSELAPHLGRSPEALAAEAQASAAHDEAWRAGVLAGLTSGSYVAMLRAGSVVYRELWIRPGIVGTYLGIVARFLFGAYAGRRRLLHEVARHRRLFGRVLAWGLVVGAIGSGADVAERFLQRYGLAAEESAPWQVVAAFANDLGALGLAAFYVAGVALLFERAGWRRALSLLAPAGRMALTNYLGQSALGVAIFCGVGLGLMGKVGGAGCFALALALFGAQVFASRLWLARFRFGPVEWAWRALTYGKAPRMRLEG